MVKKRKLPRNVEQVGEWFRYNKQVDGVRRQSKAHFPSAEAAQTALFQDLDEYRRTGFWPQRTSASCSQDETVLELFQRWINWLKHHRSPRHHRDMVGLIARACTYGDNFLNLPAAELTAGQVEQWAERWAQDLLERGHGRGEVNKFLVAGHTAYNGPWAKRRAVREFLFNPFFFVDRFSVEKRAKYVPTPSEVSTLLLAAKPPFQLYLAVMYETAARPGEVRVLAWEDVRWQEEPFGVVLYTIKTRDGSRTPRRLEISEDLAKQFAAWRRAQGPGQRYVFPREDTGEPHTPDWPGITHARLCRRAGVTRFSPGCWRHFTASRWAWEGVPLTTIQNRLGHTRATTTDNYLRELSGV
jgi:integrase